VIDLNKLLITGFLVFLIAFSISPNVTAFSNNDINSAIIEPHTSPENPKENCIKM